ncbi:MAG: HAD family phosphatase [Bacteroidetes bacterium]|nr:HAD family phosphatase [Bacteroidota bacterium]
MIFDLGGVVFDYSFEQAYHAWSAITGRPASEIKECFHFSGDFERFERGVITPEQFIASVSTQLGHTFDADSFEKGWNAIYNDVIPGMDQLLASLHTDYPLVALTNTNQIHAKVWKGKYATVLQHFDKVFVSYEMAARKPEQHVFRMVTDYLRLPADHILFLDDNRDYTASAAGMGMHAATVSSYDQVVAALAHHGVYPTAHLAPPHK